MKINKLLVANRSEIAIRVLRSAYELGIRTVAIYAHEDRFSLHRFKADEAYEVGQHGEPIRSYLDIPQIIALAKRVGVDAIHPGYGFLSENADFARACHEAGIKFIGPSVDVLERLGDKTSARSIAHAANVPILSGSEEAIEGVEQGIAIAKELGFPIILKILFELFPSVIIEIVNAVVVVFIIIQRVVPHILDVHRGSCYRPSDYCFV